MKASAQLSLEFWGPPSALPGRLLAQLAWVVQRDADGCWDADREEAMRLEAVAKELFGRAEEAGQKNNGTDAIFGPK
jgi:hypothetical protein